MKRFAALAAALIAATTLTLQTAEAGGRQEVAGTVLAARNNR